jgi:hypothetical protein
MFIEGGSQQSAVRIVQTPCGKFMGYLTDPDEGVKTFGPYSEVDELLAVMSDRLARAVREAKIEVQRLMRD